MSDFASFFTAVFMITAGIVILFLGVVVALMIGAYLGFVSAAGL